MTIATEIATIDRGELTRELAGSNPPVLLEVLSEEQYRQGHLPSALHMPLEQVGRLSSALIPTRTSPIVVYCASAECEASTLAAQKLQVLGFTNVRAYVGGKRDWIEHGLPLER